jgi:hypothetical protein
VCFARVGQKVRALKEQCAAGLANKTQAMRDAAAAAKQPPKPKGKTFRELSVFADKREAYRLA